MDIEKKIHRVTFLDSLGLGLINPFLTMFAVSLGATNFEIGILSAVVSLSNSIFQILSIPFFSYIRDRIKIYLIFSFLGGILFIPIAYVNDVYNLIFFISLQSIMISLSSISWNEILVQVYPKWRRGREAGVVNTISTIGRLISFIIGGIVIRKFGFIPYLFYFSFFFYGVLSNLFLINVKVINRNSNANKIYIKSILEDRLFLKFTLLISLFMFFVGIGAPLFDLHLIRNLNFDSIKITIVSVISLLVYYFFSESVGKACDLLGTKIIILFGLPLISIYPFLYAIGTKPLWIYLVTFVCELGWVAFNTSTFVYLSNISEKDPSKYFALYYSIVNLFSTAGRFFGGYLSQEIGIQQTLVLSFILRFLYSFIFLVMEEKISRKHVFTLSIISMYKITSYLDGFVSIYFYILRESSKTTIEKIIRNLRKFLR
ncbi:MAG: MFS transporter [Candidatus Aenigmatarchaeota archaeon]